MTIDATLCGLVRSGRSRCRRRARSMSACDWYSAECSLVYVSRIARLGLAGRGQRHVVGGVGTVQHPGDDAVLALVDRGRRRLAAHRPVHGLDGDLARERRGVGLPRRDLALARLPRGRRRVQRLADRVEDHLGRQVEQRAQAGGDRRAQVGDVVDLVRVQADRADQVDLDLVAGGDRAHQVGARRGRCAARPRRSAGCCRPGGSSRPRGTCRGSRARAPRRRWPTRPTPG